ncbi:hypothetical protein LLEC1_03892 [Akanthomyces lecanii]|uniref:Heat-labile enterotoxin, A chain n=1 Tax=Cordyceps confragosa TaxID=2714763 RepID=A0A179IIM8_CORDF|nr:hypothetical protein LLEC1_03892 [Akanthomyces lecanii]
MRLFQPVLALLGSAVLAAGYSIPGSVERVYFYYAYKLDTLTAAKQSIAPGCKGAKGPCNLDEFIRFISQNSEKLPKFSITTEEYPPVAATAQKIADKGLTGGIEVNKVVQDSGNYAALLRKIGDKVLGKLAANPKPEDAANFEICKANVFESMKSVYNERMRAAVESFKPFEGDGKPPFKAVVIEKGRGKAIDFPGTGKANPERTLQEIKTAWNQHIAGGHKENLESLRDSVKQAKDLVCPAGGSRRRTKRQALLCGEDIVQEPLPGSEDAPAPPKEPTPPKGDDAPTAPEEPTPPKGGDAPTAPVEGEVLGKSAELGETISEQVFTELATKSGLADLAKNKWSMSLSDVRASFGYKRLTPTSPKLGGGSKGISAGSGAVAVVGGALWVYGIVEAFTHDVTALDRASAVTTIIPFVGCAVQAAAALEKDDSDALDTAMCFIGDGLLLTPAWPVGIVIHVVRAIRSFFKPPAIPTLEHMQRARERTWNRYLEDDVYSYIYSHPSYNNVTDHPRRAEEKTFRDKLESVFAIEQMAVQSFGSQTIGAATASAQDDLAAANSTEAKAEMEKGILAAKEQISAAMDKEIVRRQRQVLLNLPKALKESHDISLLPTAEQYNKDFIDNVASDKMVDEYKQTLKFNADEVRQKLNDIATSLRKTSLALPGYFDMAYILGQSRALVSLKNDTLSPQDYLREKVANLSESSVQTHVLHHTLQIARLLEKKTTEDQLSTVFPNGDKQGARELQTIVAMRFGRLHDDAKFKWARKQFKGAAAYLIDGQMKGATRYLTYPEVPPTLEDAESPLVVSIVIGLTQAIVESLHQQAEALGQRRPGVLQVIMDVAANFQNKVGEPDFQWPVAVEASRNKDNGTTIPSPVPVPTPAVRPRSTLQRSSSEHRTPLEVTAQ